MSSLPLKKSTRIFYVLAFAEGTWVVSILLSCHFIHTNRRWLRFGIPKGNVLRLRLYYIATELCWIFSWVHATQERYTCIKLCTSFSNFFMVIFTLQNHFVECVSLHYEFTKGPIKTRDLSFSTIYTGDTKQKARLKWNTILSTPTNSLHY